MSLRLFIFIKCIHILFATTHAPFINLQARGHCGNQTQNCWAKVNHGQTICPLFVALKKCLHDYKPVSTSFAHLRKKRLKQYCPSQTIRYATGHRCWKHFHPLHLLQPPFLFALRIFHNPIYCHPLIFRTGE